jgi:hypothetical protein
LSKEKFSLKLANPKRSSLRYQNEPDALIVHGVMQKPARDRASLHTKCGSERRRENIPATPRVIIQFSKRLAWFLALLATTNVCMVLLEPQGLGFVSATHIEIKGENVLKRELKGQYRIGLEGRAYSVGADVAWPQREYMH